MNELQRSFGFYMVTSSVRAIVETAAAFYGMWLMLATLMWMDTGGITLYNVLCCGIGMAFVVSPLLHLPDTSPTPRTV